MIQLPENENKSIEKLFELIRVNFDIPKETLLGNSRKKDIIIARRIFMMLAFDYLINEVNITQEDIAELVNKDRTSFIYHKKIHKYDYKKYKDYRKKFDIIKEEFDKFLGVKNFFLQN